MVEESVAVDDHFLDMNAERENRGCDYLEAEPIWSFSALDVIKQHKHHAGDTQENIDMAGNARVLFPVAASSRDEHNNPVIHEQVIGSFLTSMKKEHFVCGQCSEVLVPEKLHKCSEVLFKSSQVRTCMSTMVLSHAIEMLCILIICSNQQCCMGLGGFDL